jgi:hypothetical protein
VLGDIGGFIANHAAAVLQILLSPDMKNEFHTSFLPPLSARVPSQKRRPL